MIKLPISKMKLIKLWILLFYIFIGASAFAGSSYSSNHKTVVTYVTKTPDYFEMKPAFVDGGTSIIFLQYDPLNKDNVAQPSYRLIKVDQDGKNVNYVSSPGVLDYQVLPNSSCLLFLQKQLKFKLINAVAMESNVADGWELWYLNFQEGEKVLVESARSSSYVNGYYLLGIDAFESSPSIFEYCPHKQKQIQAKKYTLNGKEYYSFYLKDDPSKTEIFTTEIWHSYTDIPWRPEFLWLNDKTLITLRFFDQKNSRLPQHEGSWEIVCINLIDHTEKILLHDSLINPYPRFCLNPGKTAFYFQKKHNGVCELWVYYLTSEKKQKIYQCEGDLSRPNFAPDGTRMVMTLFSENNSEIIRIDLPDRDGQDIKKGAVATLDKF